MLLSERLWEEYLLELDSVHVHGLCDGQLEGGDADPHERPQVLQRLNKMETMIILGAKRPL